MKHVLVVGGNSGIGLAIAIRMLRDGVKQIYIVGKQLPNMDDIPDDMKRQFSEQVTSYQVDLTAEDYSIFDQIQEVDGLVITAGFGRVALFEDLCECEIKNLMKCNALSIMQIIHKYYGKIKSKEDFYTAVMVSIAGHVSSPYFSVYGASKAALKMFIENVNIEMKAEGYSNRILDCSPGSVKGTSFNGGQNNMNMLEELSGEIISRMMKKEELYIPQYEEIFKGVIDRYHSNPEEYGRYSYQYKKDAGRIQSKPQVVVGYMSGTFDLFHIGHLNILRRAKEQCDYLIVGVHESGARKGKPTFIPFEERMQIVGHIKYVDKVIKSCPEDADVWNEYHYDKLFVGSDYQGTERFKRYEEFFADKGVEIVYFPYTKGTSSTQLREAISK